MSEANRPLRTTKRDGKFYDSVVNKQIRFRMDTLGLNAPALQRMLAGVGCSVSAEAIRQWISGYSQPKIENLPMIADALECSVNYLFGGTNILDIQRQSTTLEDLHFTDAAIERIHRLSTCQSLVDCGIARAEAKDSPVVEASEQYALLMRLLEDDDFYVFLTNAATYTALDTTGWPERSTLNLPDGNTLDIPSGFVKDAVLKKALSVIEDTLRRLGGATNVEES